MSFFLTDEQEDALNMFLDKQNQKVCEEQLNSEELADDLKEIVRKTVEAGSPIPAFDPRVGYYSVSFTPCEKGNRIYVHHHITNVSEEIYDPLLDESVYQPVKENSVDLYPTEIIEDDEFDSIEEKFKNMTPADIEATFGPPPEEVQAIMKGEL